MSTPHDTSKKLLSSACGMISPNQNATSLSTLIPAPDHPRTPRAQRAPGDTYLAVSLQSPSTPPPRTPDSSATKRPPRTQRLSRTSTKAVQWFCQSFVIGTNSTPSSTSRYVYPSALIPRVRYPSRSNDESQTLSIRGFEFGSSPWMRPHRSARYARQVT